MESIYHCGTLDIGDTLPFNQYTFHRNSVVEIVMHRLEKHIVGMATKMQQLHAAFN